MSARTFSCSNCNEPFSVSGFGMPFEEKRSGNRQPPKKKSNAGIVDAIDTTSQLVNSLLSTKGSGTPHATMTEAAKKTTKEIPSIIDKHMNDLFSRHNSKNTSS